MDGHLDSFLVLAIMNNAAMNTRVHVFVWLYVFNSLDYIYLGVELLGRIY